MNRLSKNDFYQNDRSEFLARSFIVSLSLGKGGFARCKDTLEHKIAFLKKNNMVNWFQIAKGNKSRVLERNIIPEG